MEEGMCTHNSLTSYQATATGYSPSFCSDLTCCSSICRRSISSSRAGLRLSGVPVRTIMVPAFVLVSSVGAAYLLTATISCCNFVVLLIFYALLPRDKSAASFNFNMEDTHDTFETRNCPKQILQNPDLSYG